MPHEPLAEFGDISGGVGVDGGAVGDAVDVAPRVRVLVVETAVINVFSDQFHCRLLPRHVNLSIKKYCYNHE